MATTQDLDLGIHKGRKRVLSLNVLDIGLTNETLAAGGGSADSQNLYGPGFTHFVGQIIATTPVSTVLEVLIQPTIAGTSIAQVFFAAATITTFALAGASRYTFCWGEARGPLTEVLGTGSTFVFGAFFRLRVRNIGGNVANGVTIEGLEYS